MRVHDRRGRTGIDETARLRALEELRILDTPQEERFDRVTRLCRRLFDVPMAAVTLVADDRQWFKSRQGFDADETPREFSFCSIAIEDDDLMVVEDATEDERFAENPYVTGDPRVRFYAGQPLKGPSGQRVGALCIMDRRTRTLTASEAALLTDLALWVEKEMAIDEEMERAARIQQSLLPSSAPALVGYQLAATCIPCREVGGDFYDWYVDKSGALTVTLADVMGKGMGAAIVMATVRAVLRASSQPAVDVALSNAGDALEADLEQTGTFVTAYFARLEPATGEIHYADAGHGLAIHVAADGTLERTAIRGLPLGALSGSTWEAGVTTLAPGDSLVIFSDGILDAFGGQAPAIEVAAKFFLGDAHLDDAVDDLARSARASGIADDITVVAIRRVSDTPSELEHQDAS